MKLKNALLLISLILSNHVSAADEKLIKRFDSAHESAESMSKLLRENDRPVLDYEKFYSSKGFSGKEFLRVGVHYLSSATSIEELEKGLLYIKLGKSSKESGVALSSEGNNAYVQSLIKAGNYYIDPEGDFATLRKALDYHRQAAWLGAQSSFLTSGYIVRTFTTNFHLYQKSINAQVNKRGMISAEINYFLNGANCTDENMSREFMPFVESLCQQSSTEMQNAENRLGRLSSNSSRELTYFDAVSNLIAPVIALGVLGAFVGAGDGYDSSASNQYQGFQVSIGEEHAWYP